MWQEKDNQLIRTFVFPDFVYAFAFLTKVALLAEKHSHHPHIINTYNKVTLQLTTHDAYNTITYKDRKLAREIDAVFEAK